MAMMHAGNACINDYSYVDKVTPNCTSNKSLFLEVHVYMYIVWNTEASTLNFYSSETGKHSFGTSNPVRGTTDRQVCRETKLKTKSVKLKAN